jgi:leader peptidase (prepilin peptidase)/N-methyltransferase
MDIYGTILGLYTSIFVLIAVIDIEHRLVLNVVMIPAFIWAFIEIVVSHRIDLGDALHGYAVGQLVVMGIYLLGIAYLWFVNTTRDEPITEVAFGFGDVTLATLCGLIVGYPNVVMMLVLMILLGGAISLLYIIFRMLVARDYRPHIPIAYGPAILIATFVVMLWGENITHWIYSR